MAKSLKQQFPISEGWLHLEMIMKDHTPKSEAEIKAQISSLSGEGTEFAHVSQHGNKIKAVYREAKRKPITIS